jgi:hypothetical protein
LQCSNFFDKPDHAYIIKLHNKNCEKYTGKLHQHPRKAKHNGGNPKHRGLSNRPTKSVISQLIKSKNNTKDLLCQEALGYSFVTQETETSKIKEINTMK